MKHVFPPVWLKVVYTFYFFEPQNIEQGISNVEVPQFLYSCRFNRL